MANNVNYDIILCNFELDLNLAIDDKENFAAIWNGDWSLTSENDSKMLIQSIWADELQKSIEKNYTLKNDVFRLGIKILLTFISYNWQTHPEKLSVEEYLGIEWNKEIDARGKLEKDSELIGLNILYPELFYLASEIFQTLHSIEPDDFVYLWWNFRCKVTHQRIMEENCATLFIEMEMLIAKLWNEQRDLVDKPRLGALLLTEIGQAYLIYSRVQKAQEYLSKAQSIVGLTLELKGVLGKRTKHQQVALPQLALSSTLDSSKDRPSAADTPSDTLPPQLELDDDVRLNTVQYNEAVPQAELPSLEQTLCLFNVQYLEKAQPKDNLMQEELLPYIEMVLAQKAGPWSTRVAALMFRCKLEANHKRTVERAMQQCEAIVKDKNNFAPTVRLSYHWASGLQPGWCWRHQLADLYLSLGMLKGALHEYLTLHLWEDVVVCYTMLHLKHKAAEIIQTKIDTEPSVKLYCLLGDTTDEITCYEKAWEFSKHKSSRAKRHWGNFLFDRKLYAECIPHYVTSVEINSIQEHVWLRLGFAALETEQWELAAKAYRRYTYLEPNSFEAWNNLAKIYVKQGDKQRAYKALMEALKFNYENWKLWENVILISMSTNHHDDAVVGVHRMLDLRGKFEDVEVLTLLVRGLLESQEEGDPGQNMRYRKRLLELFGRVTSIHRNRPEIWQLYADISPTFLLRGQRLLKAYGGYAQNGHWPNSPETCKQVIELTKSLLECSKKARQESEAKNIPEANSLLSSARLTGQAVVIAAEKHYWPECLAGLDELKTVYNNLSEYIRSIM